MAQLYDPAEAARMTGLSVSSIRGYTNRFGRYFSDNATGRPRKLTMEDIKLCAFVNQFSNNETYQEIEQRLRSGELRDFHFQPDISETQTESRSGESERDLLVPAAMISVIEHQLIEARLREEQVRTELTNERSHNRSETRRLQDELQNLQREVGRLEGQIEELRRQQGDEKKSFWQRLFGG